MQKKLLLVDDHPDLMEVMTVFLTQRGYQVLKGRNGTEALEIAASQVPDLIILDIYLPGMDGFKVASKLRENAKTRHIPLLALTGKSMWSDSNVRRENIFNAYFTKPAELKPLEIKIQELTNLGRARNGTERPLSFKEFRGSIEQTGVKVNETNLRHSYRSLIWFASHNDSSWAAVRTKMYNLVHALMRGPKATVKRLRPARLPVTSRGWKRF